METKYSGDNGNQIYWRDVILGTKCSGRMHMVIMGTKYTGGVVIMGTHQTTEVVILETKYTGEVVIMETKYTDEMWFSELNVLVEWS